MIKRLVLLSIIAGILALFALPVYAAKEGDVIIGQEVVLRIRFAAGGLTVQQRVDEVTVRINKVLGSQPFDPADVKVGVQGKDYVVFIGSNVIITADKATADYNKATPEQLANIWAENLRRVIPKAKALSKDQVSAPTK